MNGNIVYEPQHDKTNKVTRASSEDSDQPGHPPSLIRVFAFAKWVATYKESQFLHADSEDSDQTGRMPRLIWVFAGRKCHFVGFVMRRLIYDIIKLLTFVGVDIIQLLTFVEVDMKCYWTVNFILTDAKRRSIWIVYCSIALHVHRNKSQQLFYYIKNISVEKSVIYAKFRLTFLHKPCDITTLRHILCDISWSDVTIHATLGRYVTNHATSSIVDLTWLATGPMKWLLFIYYIIRRVIEQLTSYWPTRSGGQHELFSVQ